LAGAALLRIRNDQRCEHRRRPSRENVVLQPTASPRTIAGTSSTTTKDYLAKSRIDAIEAFCGPERDIETLTYPLYEELIAEVGCLSAETQRHYANMLLAMLNRAKAQRVIPRHHLEDVPVPQVDEPEPWSRLELGILMGPALREYETEQQAVTLGPANRTGWYQLDKHKNVTVAVAFQQPPGPPSAADGARIVTRTIRARQRRTPCLHWKAVVACRGDWTGNTYGEVIARSCREQLPSGAMAHRGGPLCLLLPLG
jgi:hypothetical protein